LSRRADLPMISPIGCTVGIATMPFCRSITIRAAVVSSFVRGIVFPFGGSGHRTQSQVRGYRAQCEQGDEAGAEEGLEVTVIAFAAGQDSTRRLMISPAWNRVSRSWSLSWATAF